MPLRDLDARRAYHRRLMRWLRVWKRIRGRYEPFVDERGCVRVVALTNFSLWGQPFVPGRVYRLRPRIAARLELAGLVEVLRPQYATTAHTSRGLVGCIR